MQSGLSDGVTSGLPKLGNDRLLGLIETLGSLRLRKSKT